MHPQIKQEQEAKAYETDILTITHYTVKVDDIPRDCFDRHEMKNFFKRFGTVVDVAIAYNDGDRVLAYKARGRIRKEMVAAKQGKRLYQLEKLVKRLTAIDAEIAEIERTLHKESVCAFVTFELAQDKAACVRAYPTGFWNRLFMPKDLRYRGTIKLRVTDAPEPSNILFTNLRYTASERRWRRLFTSLVVLIILSISIAAVYVAQYYQSRVPLNETCPSSVTLAEAQQDPTLLDCYCDLLGSDVLSGSNKDLCSDWISRYALSKALTFVCGLTIFVVNFVMQRVRPHALTLLEHEAVTVIFCFEFYNASSDSISFGNAGGNSPGQV